MNIVITYIITFLSFILPIPHTIGVRNVLAGLLTLLVIIQFIRNKQKIDFSYLKKPFMLLLLLSLWIIVNAFFISIFPHTSQREIVGQWLVPMIYLFDFAMIGFLFNKDEIQKLFNYIFVALLIHVLYVDAIELKYYLYHHSVLTRIPGLEEGSDKSNYLTNIVLSFLAAEIIYRIRTKHNILYFNNINLGIILLFTILSSAFEGMRNGVVAILFLGVSTLFFSLYKNENVSKKIKYFISIFIIGLFVLPAYYNFTHDSRWKTLKETIPIALQTQKYKHWLYPKKIALPKLPDGSRASASNYERVAWAYEGLKIIFENPLGVGWGRNAFGHAIQKKYNLKKRTLGHSHSGIIDFTIALGWPGLILWLLFILYMLKISIKYAIKEYNFFAILMFFNVTGFVTRWLVDSNMRDHMFLMFIMIVGITYTGILKLKVINEKNSTFK